MSDVLAENAANPLEVFSTRAVFFCSGLAVATWAAIIPLIKRNTGISDGTLGWLLLCLGTGAILSMPISGALAPKFGCRRIILVAGALFSLVVLLLPWASNSTELMLLLLLSGFGLGAADCVMNIQAILVEKRAGTNLMSGFHGFYSLGGIFGAGIMAFLLNLKVTASQSCVLVALLVVGTLWYARGGLLPFASPKEGPAFAIPRGPVLLIGLICFALFLAEGTVLDWSGVYLTEYQHTSHSNAALGLFCFSVTMTLGRLTGDQLIRRVGARPVLTLGGLVASGGLFLAVSAPGPVMALVGYALVGIGCSNIVPIMFSATGKQTLMPQSIAVPAVSTLGYIGVLAGPASVGQLAQYFSLPVALYAIATLIALATLLSLRVRV
ncbi:MFS transporter [Parathalassolituus penaei]|uniref:MFS transporter n=1 Tax=Parathalassolituus penaei TaxID=2997323 RepID=A0A9X3IQC5_9GAMM|nr:MFS transporter [Parathalassolituus penaei]MCY0964027.1 MFS transporter [Parathalassolituus penaei]